MTMTARLDQGVLRGRKRRKAYVVHGRARGAASKLQRFIAAEINPHVDEWEAAGQLPTHELFKKLGNLGFLGLTKPVEFGGAARLFLR